MWLKFSLTFYDVQHVFNSATGDSHSYMGDQLQYIAILLIWKKKKTEREKPTALTLLKLINILGEERGVNPLLFY